MGWGLLLAGVGFLLGGGKGILPEHMRKEYPNADFNMFVGLTRIPDEGRKKEVRDTMAGVVSACQDDPECAAWAFESTDEDGNKRTPGFCGMPSCDMAKCMEEKTCNECCPAACITMVSDGKIQTDSNKVAACKAKNTKGACTNPCMWVGDDDPKAFCTYAPSSWGKADAPKTPDRMWCMSCPVKKGKGYLYKYLNRADRNDFDEKEKPHMTSLTSSEMACFNLIQHTLGVKMKPNKPWEKDAENMFVEGFVGFVIGMVLILASFFVQNGEGINKITKNP